MHVSGLENANGDALDELQTITRNLSSFISAGHREEDAEQFWRTLSQDPLLSSSQRQLATQEASRISQRR
jgi:hypothetical protein